MEQQSRLMFVLAAVLLALVAVIVLAEPSDPEDPDSPSSEEDWTALFDELGADRIVAADMVVGDETRSFLRDDEGWRITAPILADADDIRVEALLDRFASVEVGAELAGDPADFGLDQPVASLVLQTRDGVRHQLHIGRDAPVGSHTYVRAGSEGAPRASRTKLSANLQTPLTDLRVRALWSLPRTAVDRLEVRAPSVSLELQRAHGDWWVRAALAEADDVDEADEAVHPTGSILSGPARRADSSRVQALLEDLADIEATGFVESPDFDASALPWTIEATTAGASMRLSAGQTDDGSWIATGPRQPGLVTLSPTWHQGLLRPVGDWWSDELVTVDQAELAQLELVLGDRRLVATRSEAGWSPPQASRVLEAIRAVRVSRADTEAPAGTPWGRLVLTPVDGDSRTLTLHQLLPDGARVVVDEAGGAPFALSELELGRLTGALPGAD